MKKLGFVKTFSLLHSKKYPFDMHEQDPETILKRLNQLLPFLPSNLKKKLLFVALFFDLSPLRTKTLKRFIRLVVAILVAQLYTSELAY